jgi:carboxyl-terminal processing protease
MQNNSRPHIYLPIAFALVLVAGLFLGFTLFKVSNSAHTGIFSSSGQNINEIIGYIENNYVDTVNATQLREEAITKMLSTLDPHSVYIPASDFVASNEDLRGNFEGIGVQFRIERDTVMVVNTVGGGPSEKVGVLAGDRIIKADGQSMAGVKITNDKVMKHLKGPKGTHVKIVVIRRGLKNPIVFDITRDKIPTYSIDVAYPVSSTIGYVKLSKFSATTHAELAEAMKDLKRKGVKKLILDLRGNGGGYLNEAISVADEFLPKGKLIVYTKGIHRPKQSAYSTSEGEWDALPVTVLIDEGSASASEIVAGAIQDNDRGTIIGRRSFGKGLVQEPLDLSDGSEIRLTVARYYTPTGRCIQRSYTRGTEDYYLDYYHRFQDGEMESADSIKLIDSLKFKTPGGKIVYGGGGIMPDIFIPAEKATGLEFYNVSLEKGLLYQFAFDYTDLHRNELKKSGTFDTFDRQFIVTPAIYQDYIAFAAKNGISFPAVVTTFSQSRIAGLMKSFIARNLFDDKGFYPVYLRSDKTFLKAKAVLEAAK